MKKLLSAVICMALCCALSTGAAASRDTRQIEITYRAISITLNGGSITPTDAAGNAVAPFIYEGTTYLPVRGIANALSLSVSWDDESSTITLKSGAGSANPAVAALDGSGTETCSATYRDIKIVLDGKAIEPRDSAGNAVEPFLIDGTTYLPVRAIAEALGLQVSWDGAANTVCLTKAASGTGTDTGTGTGAGTGGASTGAPAPDNASVTVYVTQTGKRYHYSGTCNGGTYYESTLADALARGLTPCNKCVN